MNIRKCRACGQGNIKPSTGTGRRMQFRMMPDLPVPDTLEIPTCDNCGREYINSEAAKALDIALEVAFADALQVKARESLALLARRAPQYRLEGLLGLSGGYLSKIKKGKDASPALIAALMLLASRPDGVEELSKLWRVTERSSSPPFTTQNHASIDATASARPLVKLPRDPTVFSVAQFAPLSYQGGRPN